jgi:putative oxidoreductase
MNGFAGFTGRVLMGSLFIAGALVKWTAFASTAQWLDGQGVPLAPALLGLAIALELAGGALLLLGLRTVKAAWVMAAYLVAVTLIVHHDFTERLNIVFAFTNLGLLGGLMVLAEHGAPKFGLDAWLGHHGRVDTIDAATAVHG